MPKITISATPITHLGRTHTLREWAALLQIQYTTVAARYRRGIRDSHLLLAPTPGRGKRSDIPTQTTRGGLGKLAYNPVLHLLPHGLRTEVLAYCGHDPAATYEFLRTCLMQSVSSALGRIVPDSPSNEVHEVMTHPLGALVTRLPKEQREALLSRIGSEDYTYDPDPDVGTDIRALDVLEALEIIAHKLVPKALQRLLPEGGIPAEND